MIPSRHRLRGRARPSSGASAADTLRRPPHLYATAYRTALRVALTLLLLLLLTLLARAAARAQDASADAQAIVTAINEARAANNLLPLRVNGLLNQAAQNHVDDLVANGIYGHYGSDGSNVRTRVARTGYGSAWVSENWVTSGSPAAAMEWWMNDWIHRVNILTPHWDEVGVGIAALGNGYFIYVTDFANSTGQPMQTGPLPPAVINLAGEGEAAATVLVPAGGMDYVIRGGDTLYGIALRYGLDWQDIAVANGLGEFDILSIGRTIRLPGVGGVGGPVAAGGLRYSVEPGDTLSGIAARYAIAWQDIASANGLGEWSVLQIGMTLRLPGVPEETVNSEEVNSEQSAADEPGTDSLDTTSLDTTSLDTTSLDTDQPDTGPLDTGHSQYTVRRGETAWSIAADHGLAVGELLAANGLGEDDVLAIGQTLTLPGVAAPQQAAEAAALAEAADPAVTAAPDEAQPPVLVVGASEQPPAAPSAAGFNLSLSASPWDVGETRGSAASDAGVSRAESAAGISAPALDSAARTYTVQPGDTIWSIAARTGVEWRALLARNGMDEDALLQVGQVLALE